MLFRSNYAKISHHDTAMIDGIEEELNKENNGLFNMLRPNPTGEWQYDWSCENWGTKWDASIIDWERRDDNEIWVSFESAWAPPTRLYEYIVEQGWEVDAVYHEGGMGYAGLYTTEDGEGFDDYYEYDLGDPESIEDLPSDVIEFGDLRTKSQEHIIYMLEEEWGDAERTEWYPMTVCPVRDGWYEVQCKNSQYASDPNGTYIQFVKYDELLEWDFWNNELMINWRGLAKDPSEAEVD